jgi:hypothetical protein
MGLSCRRAPKQSTLVEPTYPKTGVYNSKIACQTQINGSAQRVPKLPANGLHDYGHIALFKLTAGSPESCDLRPNGWLQLSMAPWSSMPPLSLAFGLLEGGWGGVEGALTAY